jgi:hypothetical protein
MNKTTLAATPIERIGGIAVLGDDDEIAAAFTARDALEDLCEDARLRVLKWVAESFDIVTG